jgi:Uma2 family endonuclease
MLDRGLSLAICRVCHYTPAMPTMVSISDKVERRLWTAEEFLEWLKPGLHADLIDGEKIMHSPVNFKHARLLNFVHCLLSLHVEQRKLGEVHREVVAVRLAPRQVFLPDLCYFTKDQMARLLPTYAPFAPTLVVEALSPWTAELDTGPKFAAYEEHGVREYWLLDPEHLAHRFYRREGELLVEFAAGAERVPAQTIPGFWLNRSWLNPERLPEVRQCLAEMGATG